MIGTKALDFGLQTRSASWWIGSRSLPWRGWMGGAALTEARDPPDCIIWTSRGGRNIKITMAVALGSARLRGSGTGTDRDK